VRGREKRSPKTPTQKKTNPIKKPCEGLVGETRAVVRLVRPTTSRKERGESLKAFDPYHGRRKKGGINGARLVE